MKELLSIPLFSILLTLGAYQLGLAGQPLADLHFTGAGCPLADRAAERSIPGGRIFLVLAVDAIHRVPGYSPA